MTTPGCRRASAAACSVFLSSSLLLMIAGATVVTYWVAVRSANDAYDRSLLDPALDIAENIRIDASGRPRRSAAEGARGARLRPGRQGDLPGSLARQRRHRRRRGSARGRRRSASGQHDLLRRPLPGRQRSGSRRIARAERHSSCRSARRCTSAIGSSREILVAELVPTLLIAVGGDRARVARRRPRPASARTPARGAAAALAARSAADCRRPRPRSRSLRSSSAFNRLLRRLRDASTMQQRFLANAAHQLRTPLAGLQMHLELLLRARAAERTCAPKSSGCTARRCARAASPTSCSHSPRPRARPTMAGTLEIVDLRASPATAAREMGAEGASRARSTWDSRSSVQRFRAIRCCCPSSSTT